jgi:threonine/homoserine/homoserine lactone efflux protein
VATQFTAFLGVALLVIVMPGQDTALTIRNTLLGGRRRGVFTALGVSSGQAVWTVATSAGLAALLLASEPVFVALKLAGAAYLVYLGAQALRSALFSRGWKGGASVPSAGRELASSAAYRQGLISNLGNPKMAVFFTSLLPQFTPAGEASFAGLLALGLLFCLLTLVWLTGYAVAVAKAGDVLRRPRIRRAVEGVTGAVLVGLGLRLASERG